MIPDRDIDHVGQGLALFINQYRNKPRFAAWASAYLKQCQQLEDAIYDVLIKRLIENAVGVQCDAIGRIVGEYRRGLDDATYKIFIAARVRINRSRGNVDDVLAVLALVTKTPAEFREYRPSCLFLNFLEIVDQDVVLIYTMLRDTKAAGVKLTMIVPTSDTVEFLPMDAEFGTSNLNHAVGDAVTPSVLGLLSDVVSVRDPKAIPVLMPLPPTIAFLDPAAGPV